MAKQWKPTQKQISTYEELVKKYNKIRKQIINAHRNLEKQTPTGRMPSLVVPERHRKMTLRQMRITGKMLFKLKVKQLSKIVNRGLKGFYQDYKRSYLELYRTYIIGEEPDGLAFGTTPLYYTDEQIKLTALNDKDMAKFMQTYNDIVRLNPYVFAFLIKSGKMPEFKQLYSELGKGLTFPESFVEQSHRAVKNWGYFMNTKEGGELLKKYFEGDKRAIQKAMKLMRINKYRFESGQTNKQKYGSEDED